MSLLAARLTISFVIYCSAHLTAATGGYVDDQVAEGWSQAGKLFSKVLWPHRQDLAALLRQLTIDQRYRRHLSSKCSDALWSVAEGLDKQQQWAIEMLDASGFGSPGYMTRLAAEFGDYDQCLDVQADRPSRGDPFAGQFCLFRIHMPMPPRVSKLPDHLDISRTKMNDTWLDKATYHYKYFYYEKLSASICFPSSCQPKELEPVLHSMAQAEAPLNITIWTYCDTNDVYDITFSDFPLYKQVAIYFLALMVSFVIAASWISHLVPEGFARFLYHFNVNVNSGKLFQESSDPLAQKLSWIHGARIVYLILATSMHMGIIGAIWTPISHAEYVQMKPVNFPLLAEFSSNISVGIAVNFVLGGMLAFVSWIPELRKRNGKLNFSMFVFGRWFRTFPLVLGVIVVTLAFPMTWGSGPLWREGYTKIQQNCLKNWWTEFLYISNFIDSRDACLTHAWYLGADFQLYLTSFFILIALFKRPKVGIYLSIGAIVFGMIAQGSIIYFNDTGAYFNYSETDFEKLITVDAKLHLNTLNYISPYYIGILLGFLVVNDYKITDKRVLTAGWIFFISLCFLVYLIPKFSQFSRTDEIIFGAVQRAMYAMGYAWGFFCGSNGQAGFLNPFLTNRVFLPIGRMSGSVFLTHFLFIWWDIFNLRRPIEGRTFTFFMRLFYTVICAIGLGYFMYLIFEAPLINIGKSMFVKKKSLLPNPVVEQNTSLHDQQDIDENNNVIESSPQKLKGA